MSTNANDPVMSQKIFTMNLDVNTVSLYLLCCAVADRGSEITKEMLMEKWNGGSKALDDEIDRLEKRRILERTSSQGTVRYRIADEKVWR